MEKKHKKDPLSPKETTRKEVSSPELQESPMRKDYGSEKQASADVSVLSLTPTELSSTGYLESDTAKDYDNEKQGSAVKGPQGWNVPHDDHTIQVQGFNTETSDETIESFFENKRRSGGGDIKNIVIDRTNDVIYITYCDPTVAENVLKKPELKLEGAMLEVSPVPQWDRRTIEVHGLRPSTSNDAIELFFESKRRSGGDAVEHMQLDNDNNIAYVTFESPEAAEKVMKNTLQLEGVTLTVQPKMNIPPRHQSTQREMENDHDLDERSIQQVRSECEEELRTGGQVCDRQTLDFNLDKSAETHVKYVESVDYCGREGEEQTSGFASARITEAGDSSHETPRKREVALQEAQTPTRSLQDIPFEPGQAIPPTAAPVEASGHTGPPTTALVEPPGHTRPPTVEPLVAPRNVIVVSGIKETTTEELLKMFFENKKRSGGGPVKQLDYQNTEGLATITFLGDEDAQRVLQHGTLSLEGAELVITQMEVEETTHEKDRNPTPSCVTTDMSSAHILEIRGFKPGTKRDTVEMFIENKSGESELQSCDYDTKTGVAVVAFKNDQGATKLMNLRKLELEGAQLSVTRLTDIYAGLDRESCRPRAIHVQGICKDTSEEFLQLFFENRRKSGGGDIEHVDYHNEEGIAVITFKDADSARRVVQKEPMIICGTRVEVKLMTPPMSLPFLQGPFQESLVLVSGLSPMCTGDDLKTFFSAQNIQSEIQCVIFSLKPGVAMLQFTHPPEFDRLREICVTKPLRGTMLSLQKVPQSTTIQVHNIGDVTEDMLTLFFENKRSGGGEVANVQVCRKDDYALFEFLESANVQNILAKENHTVQNHALCVSTYYECLGLTPPHHDTTIPGGWIPKNVAVTGFCPRVLNFLQTSAVSRELVNSTMAEVAAEVEWGTYNDGSTTSIELTCTINYKMKNAQTMAKTWSQTVSKTFLDVLASNFASGKIETLQEAWPQFKGCIGYVDELDSNRICVDVNDDACSVCFAGQIKEVDDISAKLKDDHSKVQDEMTKAATIVTETKSGFKLHQLRMLNAKAFKSQQQKKYTDLTVVIDMKSLDVKFTGMPGDITLAMVEMYEILNNMTEKFLEKSASLISILHGKDMMKHMVGEFKNRHICAVYNGAGENKLGVYALSEEHLNTAIEVINATAGETSVKADVSKLSAPEKWTELINAQQSKHDGLLTVTECGNTVVVAGAKSRMEVALEEIQSFLKDNIIDEQFVQMEHGIAGYIHKYMMKEINNIMEDFRHSSVKITPHLDGPYGYVVAGSSYGLQGAVQRLQKLPDDIKLQQFQIDKPGMTTFLTSDTGQHSIERLEYQHNVVIEPVGKYAQKDEVLASDAGGSNIKSSVALGGATVEVIRGDLTKFHADAIVNAANGQLEHAGGLARAIVDAGGHEIQQECKDYIWQHGSLNPGQVYVSSSGRMPCKKVIHAVGPIWQDGRSNEENSLYNAVFESMLAAERCGLSSIALPALSSGIFRFPIDRCTKTIVSAVKDFLDAPTRSCVKKVSLLDPTEDVVKTFHQSLVAVFGSQMVTTSFGGQGSSQKKARTKRQRQASSPVFSRSPRTMSSSKYLPAATHRKQTPMHGKTQLTTAEGIKLTLCKSEIAKQQVGAIVNSTNCSLQLNRGAVSQTLLRDGGKNIETECQQNAPDGIQLGEIVVTSGGRLSCQYIVHGACCSWDGGAGQSERILRQFLTNCFQAAHDHELKSIAIPAIGTGQLGFPRQVVATVMLDELRKFSSRNPQTPLRDVRFVVYQKDHHTIQAFEEVLFNSEPGSQEAESRPARTLASPQETEEGAIGGIPSPSSVSEESDDMISIGSINVDVVHGDLTKERTDAIVNSSSNTLDLSGATSRAIVQAGGPSVVEECKRLGKTGSNGIAVTDAGLLPCSHIIHIDAPRYGDGWTTIIENVLMEADSLHIESVAFPALGTGRVGYNPDAMADAMLDAIERFTQKKPDSSLKLVKIVIFQHSMLQSFRKRAFKKASGKKGWISSVLGRVKEFFLGDDMTMEERPGTRQHVTFNIFGQSHAAINAAKKAMQQLCDNESTEIILNSEQDQVSIAKLTSAEINQMGALGDNLDVKITIQNTRDDVSISIQGRPIDTSQARAEILNIFRQVEDHDKTKLMASLYEKQVHWKYANEEGFTKYPKEINGLLESAFQSKKSHFEWKEDNDEKYCVTFKTMKETTHSNRTGVAVKREDVGGSVELPSHWSPMDGDEHVKLVQVQATSQEYKTVESTFMSTAQQTVNSIKKVERVQNLSLYRQYMLRKEEMKKRSKQTTANERSLWHGTSADAITSINNSGFNRSYCGKNATAFGQGVYFAVGSSYSANNQYATPDANGLKHVYQALVVTGEYTTGHSSYRVPPPNPATPGFPFDTVVDNASTPGIFVIFLDNQAYPEYLITFS